MALEGVRVALDPTPEQERAMLSHAGAARMAFNAGLARVKEQLAARDEARAAGAPVESLPQVDWNLYALRRWWNSAKRELAPWWAENSKEAYSSGLDSLARALKAFSDSRSGKRRGPRAGFPEFRSRARSRMHWAYTTGAFGIADPYGVKLPRIGRVHTLERIDTRVGDARILRTTVTRSAGRWFATFTVDRERAPVRRKPRPTVGVDLGVKILATLSDGRLFDNPRHLNAAQRRLARAGRAYSRTQRGSAGRKKAAARLGKLHARVAHLRGNALHQVTARITLDYELVVLEDLNVSGMLRNHTLARHIADASFAELRRQLEYKLPRHGGRLVLADRFFPSSKICSNCGTAKATLSLSERIYRCPSCGTTLDRDMNAAINLQQLVAGSGPETQNGDRATHKTRPGGQQAMKSQPRTRIHAGQDTDRQLATVASRGERKTQLGNGKKYLEELI